MNRIELRDIIREKTSAMLKDRRVGLSNLLEWGVKYFPHYFPKKFGRHHRQIARKLMRFRKKRGARCAIKGPRGSAKSTILTFLYPIRCIVEGWEPYIMLLADTYTQASKYLAAIKHELEANAELAAAYPSACGKGSEWRNDGILTRNGIKVEPLGTEQKIRGRKQNEQRPTLIIIDDPEGDEAAYSSVQRNSVREWAMKGAFKAGKTGLTNIIVIGTVIHRQCLVAHCASLPGWDVMEFKSITQWPNRMDLWQQWELLLRDPSIDVEACDGNAQDFFFDHREEMIEGAEVLWPEDEDLYALMYMRTTEGHTSFESEKQNNPVDPSRCEWEPQLFEGDDIWFDDWPKDLLCATMALDPSKGRQDKSGDYQATISLGVGVDGCLYVDCDMKRRPLSEMVRAFVHAQYEFEPDVAVCEAEQFQELLIAEIETTAAQEQLLCPIEGITTEGKPKPVRIRRIGPYISRRRIKYKRRSPGAEMLRQQLMDFPNGDYDDGPDALEMAERRARMLLADHAADGAMKTTPY